MFIQNVLKGHLLIVIDSLFLVANFYLYIFKDIVIANKNYVQLLCKAMLIIVTLAFTNILTKIKQSYVNDNSIETRKKELCVTLILSLTFFVCLFRIFIDEDYYYIQLYVYLISLSFYHFMEYVFVLNHHFDKLSLDSFLINQSKEYIIATSFSFVEYIVEIIYVPIKYKYLNFTFHLGIIMMIIGHTFRIIALFTAKSNFTHIISHRKKKTHTLVKTGIYR